MRSGIVRLTKKQREVIRMKFGGRCAYCGQELSARWQVDHIAPVNRETKWVKQEGLPSKVVATGKLGNPENDREDNLAPACPACNNDKFNLTLEQWRRRLEDLPGVCSRNSSAYRHAVRFGLVTPTPRPVIFYFEQLKLSTEQSDQP